MAAPHKRPTPEQRKAYDAKHYQANKEKIQATHKAYRDSHLEEARASAREVYYRNHDRNLKLKRLRSNKKIYRENLENLLPLFNQKEMPMDAKIKASFLSMIRAEIYLSNIKAEQEDNTPEIGLMKLHDDTFDKTWEAIALDDELMNKIKVYVLQADPDAFEDLTI